MMRSRANETNNYSYPIKDGDSFLWALNLCKFGLSAGPLGPPLGPLVPHRGQRPSLEAECGKETVIDKQNVEKETVIDKCGLIQSTPMGHTTGSRDL